MPPRHVACARSLAVEPPLPDRGRHTRDEDTLGNVIGHDSSSCDHGTLTDGEVVEDDRAHPDVRALAEFARSRDVRTRTDGRTHTNGGVMTDQRTAIECGEVADGSVGGHDAGRADEHPAAEP